MATTSAVQFSEKCLRQEGGGVKVDGEIIFQAPLPGTTDGSTTIEASSENKDDNSVSQVYLHESPLDEETPSILNVAAPEFVPVSVPTEMKDDENAAVSSSSNVSSSQSVYPHKYRHFNKHQPYHQYPMIPDYSMIRGPIPSHLPLPYPYMFSRHPRDPLIPLSMPFGYSYPPIQLQQSRMFPDGAPRHVYTAGVPSEFYMMEFGTPFQQNIQSQLYSWAGVPEHTPQSPDPEHELHDGQDDRDGAQEIASPNASTISDAVEPRSHDNVASFENDGDQLPTASSSDNMLQYSTIIENNDSHLDDASDSSVSNAKTDFSSEEVHPIKDNSTGQVVDTGYIHKHIDNNPRDELPPPVVPKASPECDDSGKSDLESSLEKTEVIELSQEIPSTNSNVEKDETYCTTGDICDPVKQLTQEDKTKFPLEDKLTTQTVTEVVKSEPQPTITPPISIDKDDNKVVSEEKLTAPTPPVMTKKLPSTSLGNKINEPKVRPPPSAGLAGEPQQQLQHRVDRKTSNNSSSNNRTANQFSNSRENNYSRTDSQTPTGSGKMSSKGSAKSGPSIILRAPNAPEKKMYQLSSHVDPSSVNTSSSRDTHYSSSSSASVAPELKKSQLNPSGHSASKEMSNSSNASTSNSQTEARKSHPVTAWGQTKKWSQLFNSNNTSPKDTTMPSKEHIVQSDLPLSTGSEAVAELVLPAPNPEHINKQLKSLGGK